MELVVRKAATQIRARLESTLLTHGQREYRTRELRERLEHVEAALTFLEESSTSLLRLPLEIPFLNLRNVTVVGDGGPVPVASLSPFVQGAMKACRVSERQVSLWLTAARRFPVPAVPIPSAARGSQAAAPNPLRFQRTASRPASPRPPNRPRDSAGSPLAYVDRVDALSIILGRVRAARTRALARTMTAVVGHVIRDERILRSWLAHARASDSVACQGIILALGSLGADVPWESVAKDGVVDPDDAAAWALQVVLRNPTTAYQ